MMVEIEGVDGAASVALCGAAVVVSLDPPEVVSADVVLAGDRIAAVGAAPQGVTRRDCSGTLILPGNVCAHHHLYSALSRGMPYHLPPPVTFTEILQRVWWRLDRALDERAIRASALRGGLDAAARRHHHHRRPPRLAERRSTARWTSSPRPWPRSASAACSATRSPTVTDPGARPPASPRTAASSTRSGVAWRAAWWARTPRSRSPTTPWPSWSRPPGRAGSGVHIHVAEDAADQVDARARSGHGVVERLDRAGVLTGRALLAHCVARRAAGDRSSSPPPAPRSCATRAAT